MPRPCSQPDTAAGLLMACPLKGTLHFCNIPNQVSRFLYRHGDLRNVIELVGCRREGAVSLLISQLFWHVSIAKARGAPSLSQQHPTPITNGLTLIAERLQSSLCHLEPTNTNLEVNYTSPHKPSRWGKTSQACCYDPDLLAAAMRRQWHPESSRRRIVRHG